MECYHLVPHQWGTHYSIGSNIGRRDVLPPAPYTEHLTLEVEADLIHPKLKQTGMLKLTFLARRELESLVTSRDLSTPTPLCIGKVTLKGDRREFLGALPQDMLLHVLNRLETGSYKQIMMTGDKLRYGSAKIHTVNFCEKVDIEDWY